MNDEELLEEEVIEDEDILFDEEIDPEYLDDIDEDEDDEEDLEEPEEDPNIPDITEDDGEGGELLEEDDTDYDEADLEEPDDEDILDEDEDDEEEMDDDIEPEEEEEEEEEPLLDNQCVIPTTTKVYEGDTVMIAVVDGEPTVIGVVGRGDQVNDDIDNLTGELVVTNTLIADKASISDLEATNATIVNLQATKADITDLQATNATVSNLSTNKADITDLNASNARITSLETDKVDTSTLTANYITSNQIEASYARLDATNINTATIRDAFVDQLMVQTGLLSKSGTIYSLDAVEVNANRITAGTIDVNRLIYTDNQGQKYLVNFSGGSASYEKLNGNIIQDRTITADKIIANSITANELTTQNIVGTGGWINLANGTFNYTNANTGNSITWDGSNLNITTTSLTIGTTNVATALSNAQSDATSALTDTATLNSIIRAYSNGVLVCKNGQTIGALVNASGSFDICPVSWSGTTPTASSSSYATFGTTTRIGSSSTSHFQITSDKISGQYGTDSPFFVAGDLRGQDAVCCFISNGTSASFDVYRCQQIYSVKKDSTTGTDLAYREYPNSSNPPTQIQITLTGGAQPKGTKIYVSYKVSAVSNPYFTFGNRSDVAGPLSAVIGYCEATNNGSFAVGNGAKAHGYYSIAEGQGSVSLGRASHAEGINTEASGNGSHSEGYETVASGEASHAEGQSTTAGGSNSHAGGVGTTANGDAMTAIGKYNSTSTGALFVVGKGSSSSSKSDALVIDTSGNMTVGGYITAPYYSYTSTTNIIVPRSGITIHNFKLNKFGPIVNLTMIWSYDTNISVGANYYGTNINIADLQSGYIPDAQYITGSSDGDLITTPYFYGINSEGVVYLGYIQGTGTARTISSGTKFRLSATYFAS